MSTNVGDSSPSPQMNRRSARFLTNSSAKRRYEKSHDEMEISSGDSEFGGDTSSSEGESDGFDEDEPLLREGQPDNGTNSTLKTLSETDISHVKENREIRQDGYQDVYVRYNHERYILANKRVLFQSLNSKEARSTHAAGEKAKKPRKGNRTGRTAQDNLPEKPITNVSVSTEITRLKLEDLGIDSQSKHEEEIEGLIEDISKDFPRWQYILRENFNIVLYGYGSKEPILQKFKSFLNEEFMIVDINGHFPKLNPRKILVGIWEALLDLGDGSRPPAGNNILAMTDDMSDIMSNMDHASIYVIVHGLDRLAFKQPKFFKALCTLSQVKYIHLVATVDHINTGLGIGHNSIVDLKLFWINCTTFKKYEEELTWYGDDLTELQEVETSKSAVDQVLKSLTANARKMFRILVTLQLDIMRASGQSSHKNFAGVPFSELSRKCREAFVAHGEMALRTLLTEFLDHKLIIYAGKGKKTDNMITVVLKMDELEEYSKNS